MLRYYTASVYIKYNQKVLLHRNKKLGIIIPVGGQIKKNELPQEAAIREVKEETGLDIEILNDKNKLLKFSNSNELIKPVHIMLEEVSTGHQCVDFIFYGIADTYILLPQDGETKELFWLSESEIVDHKHISDYVKHMSVKLLNY